MRTSQFWPLVLLPALAAGSDPGSSATIARAEALLKSSDEKLAAASSLRAVYTETDEFPGEYRDLRQTATVTLSHPGDVRVEIVRARRVRATDPWKDSGNNTLGISNGKDAYEVFLHPHSTQVRSVSPAQETSLQGDPLLAGFFGSEISPTAQFISSADKDEVEGLTVEDSKISYKAGATGRTIELGQDGLIHRVVVRNEKTHASKTWELQSIQINPKVSPGLFAYVPPKEALPYPSAERSEGISNGSNAPDFEVPSPTKKAVKLSDYSGKVVLLEFWATWCWPCNQSIPQTEHLVSQYHDKGVEGLLVSIKDNRKGFDAWIQKHPQYSNLSFGYDDPVKGPAYEAFRHPQNPTLYVIGRDGKVVAKFVGYTGPDPAVEQAIKSAL